MTTTPSSRRMMIHRLAQPLFCLVLLLAHTSFALSTSTSTTGLSKVAVIGTTGRLGRQVIQQLSSMGIQTRCLLRHDLTQEADDVVVVVNSLQEATTSKQVAAYLKTLPGVEMIPGDVTDIDSLRRLLLSEADMDGCVDACLAVHGAGMPKPFFKGLFPAWFPESDPRHPKQINYHGVQNILTVLQECNNNKNNKNNKNHQQSVRLVRITGKGETPWSIFSILINAFGGMAKAWNYEAEQLIRTQAANNNIDYTIIRPGILKDTVETNDKKETTTAAAAAASPPTLGFKDNGGDLPVTAVSYQQIANLVIDVAMRDNCKRATITAMNIKQPSSSKDGDDDDSALQYQTLDQVQPDSRTFPTTLLQESKRAARVGGIVIIVFTMFMANLVASLVLRLFGFS